jgi:hypothetical protein
MNNLVCFERNTQDRAIKGMCDAPVTDITAPDYITELKVNQKNTFPVPKKVGHDFYN